MQAFKSFTIGCVLGTRPEVIKMAPVIFQLQRCAWAKVVVINTGQHKDMLEDMLEVFNVSPDVNLNVMISNQSLGKLTANLCEKLDDLMKNTHFDALLAVGDTTTVFTTSLIAFYHRIPFGHIEAGLRTFNSQEPFPEEMNRTLTAPLATWHFAPTILEKENLLREQIPASKIVVTGNPVIDALFWVLKNRPDQNAYARDLTNIIVVTAHRRENFGKNLQNICSAMIELVARFEHIHFILPVHPNPSVQQKIEALLHKKHVFIFYHP
ncbi:UDP-N-acetylglucosamine 2-epimerase [Legionella oakridgensis ATCC 33761 = DSM 21215]|uniref:UDP-N-acetylglucosamine 2-epimerase (non-hydrolyzing) n=1 Tax=Legionella oakridgensis ATCC 33761 = DSM 21215 TaxID=1268635 RepID=W0B8M2_9GAMM|nr:UDP-N-acetylglucosamine 2-epimerase [Legionella oakridgensis ATCC 33761 = DSM 21215]